MIQSTTSNSPLDAAFNLAVDWLDTFIKEYAIKRLVVGLSGGVDSVLLLHLLNDCRPKDMDILAVHVDHGLSERADQWAQFCEGVCRKIDVPLAKRSVQVINQGRGIEDEARAQRYQVFTELMKPGDALVLGHHLDDQAETLLMRLMRGSGPRGLAAMSRYRPFESGWLLRPLLPIKRQQIEAQAKSWELVWVEDESNQSLDFDRNYIRHQVMPLLDGRWPNFQHQWARSAELCQQSYAVDLELAESDLASSLERPEKLGFSLSVDKLMGFSEFRRGNLIRYWSELRFDVLPDSNQLSELDSQLVEAGVDRQLEVRWGEVYARRFQGRLYLLPAEFFSVVTDENSVEPERIERFSVPDLPFSLSWRGGTIVFKESAGCGLRPELLSSLSISGRLTGARCKPMGRNHSQQLKKLYQEQSIEPWLRDSAPLLMMDGEIAAAADFWICEGFQAGEGCPAIEIRWQPLEG